MIRRGGKNYIKDFSENGSRNKNIFFNVKSCNSNLFTHLWSAYNRIPPLETYNRIPPLET